MQDQSDEVYSNITDERLVSNGINIQFYHGKAVEHTKLNDLAMQRQSDEVRVYRNIIEERVVSNSIKIQFYHGKNVEHTT